MTKKQTLSAILVFLLIIAASAAILSHTRIAIQNTTQPIILDDSNLLDHFTPDRIAGSFLGIPWGASPKDIKGLRPQGKEQHHPLLDYRLYEHPSGQLHFQGSIYSNVTYSFSLKRGFVMAALNIAYLEIDHESFNQKIQQAADFFNCHYNDPTNTYTETSDRYITQNIEWRNESNIITLSYIDPSSNLDGLGYYYIIVESNQIVDKLLEDLKKSRGII